MTTRPETVLYSSLIDVERLEHLAREGIDSEIVPTASMRPVVEWAINYFFESGCKQAPSLEALMLEWDSIIESEEITLDDLEDETETIEWALGWLRSQHVHLQWQEWSKKAAAEMAQAYTEDRIDLLAQHTAELSVILGQVRSQASEARGTSAIEDAMRRYQQRVDLDGAPHGLMLGLELADQHTHGIHPGELAVLAAGPKTGKSWLLAKAVLTEWMRGRRGMLFTLENSVEMTIDRIVCLHAMVDYRDWQRGACNSTEFARVETSRTILAELAGDMIVVMPAKGHRTADAMIREARMRGAESVAIDQLTFVEPGQTKNRQGWEIIGDIMHDLKTGISTGRDKLPCLLAHQINREGVKAAEKTGHLEMYMLAGSSEVERTADWVFGLYRNSEDRIAEIAKFQVLASRREDVNAWLLAYAPATGMIRTMGEYAIANDG